jgi:hypothetical protein
MFGAPFYPGGMPLSPDNVSFCDLTIRQLFMKRAKDISLKIVPDFDEEEILRNYALYHIHAPLFQSEFTEELTSRDLSDESLDRLIFLCLEYGLDPF